MGDRNLIKIEQRRANAVRMAWVHDEGEVKERRDELLVLIREQYKMAVSGSPPFCACCGVELYWHQLYRCFMCDLWFCPMCAGVHFVSAGLGGGVGG